MAASLAVNLEKVAKFTNAAIPALFAACLAAGTYVSFYFHFLSVTFFLLALINFYYRHVQRKHTLLANFGIIAQARYVIESVGPELRQYLISTDVSEKPFNRIERSEVYRKAKGIDSSSAFGSQLEFDRKEIKLRHSLYPVDKAGLEPYALTFGEERGLAGAHTLTRPVMISAMSYGALGESAVRALARGARRVGVTMNTGEGGYPKYHLMEGCDLTFQMGTAKFGVRNEDGSLSDARLADLAAIDSIKMVEIKLSQGAKPGKGGLLPKEKITEEIAELRGVPMDEDVVSPPYHLECKDAGSTVAFIRRVQEVSGLPVGIKMCLGRDDEVGALIREMKRQSTFPDYISIDGAEGGTGAAPKSFMDDLGVPLFEALPVVQRLLVEEGVRDRLKLVCAGKLINPAKQFTAMSLGAQACYTARGFMLALGCIQALQCNMNTCPVGITTHDRKLQAGLDIDVKAQRVVNYVENLCHDHLELLASLGCRSFSELCERNLYAPMLDLGDAHADRPGFVRSEV